MLTSHAVLTPPQSDPATKKVNPCAGMTHDQRNPNVNQLFGLVTLPMANTVNGSEIQLRFSVVYLTIYKFLCIQTVGGLGFLNHQQ